MVSNYRPVSLTCVPCRVFETLVSTAMKSFLSEYSVLNKNQYCFSAKRSTTCRMLSCFNDWSKKVDKGNVVTTVYLGFERAFDAVSRVKLVATLRNYGIGGRVLSWITSFLADRRPMVKINDAISDTSFKYHRTLTVNSGVYAKPYYFNSPRLGFLLLQSSFLLLI